jgi:hypothetical protein
MRGAPERDVASRAMRCPSRCPLGAPAAKRAARAPQCASLAKASPPPGRPVPAAGRRSAIRCLSRRPRSNDSVEPATGHGSTAITTSDRGQTARDRGGSDRGYRCSDSIVSRTRPQASRTMTSRPCRAGDHGQGIKCFEPAAVLVAGHVAAEWCGDPAQTNGSSRTQGSLRKPGSRWRSA